MAIYSIKDMEKLSGIKAHTLRIWEQRYDLLQPKRTPTNIRYYEDADLKFLLNVALLNKNGYRVSKISKMSADEITEKVAELSEVNQKHHTQLDALTLSMLELDEFKFDRIINANAEQIGFERTMLEVIHPFLENLGPLWLTGSVHPIHENFIGNLIQRKVVAATDKLPLRRQFSASKFFLYLPEGERQELSLLFLAYLLRVRGFQVVYGGPEVSILDIKDVYRINKPDFIFTMITETFIQEPVSSYLEQLRIEFPDVQILLSGYQVVAQNVRSEKNIRVLNSLTETIAFLEHIKTQDSKTFEHSYGI